MVNWSKYFPLQEEIDDYFNRVARDFGIESSIRYGTECLVTRYDEESLTWHSRLRLPNGSEETLVTNVVLSAVGGFTTPKWPNVFGPARLRRPGDAHLGVGFRSRARR